MDRIGRVHRMQSVVRRLLRGVAGLLVLFALAACDSSDDKSGNASKMSEKAAQVAQKVETKAAELAAKVKDKSAVLKDKVVEKTADLSAKAKVKTAEISEKVKAKTKTLTAKVKDKFAAVRGKGKGIKPSGDYEKDRWHPIHFKPMIDTATNAQCLSCHQEILTNKPRKKSPAGVKAADTVAWYQTLDTYEGKQQTFHQRHLTSKFAKQVMNLKCVFCHKGNDLRDEVPNSHKNNVGDTSHVMRKTVDPAKTCLRCHGKFPYEVMEGVEGPWHEVRGDMEDPEDEDMRNGCMSCHNETYRTIRHQVNYLKPKNIEKLAKEGSSDSCYGCHGGRQWYRTNYPYPRHKWPGMEDIVEGTPDWAKNRPTSSAPEDRRAAK